MLSRLPDQYLPDFIAQMGDGHHDCLNLLLEVSGEPKKEKAAKVAAARSLWIPAVNNLGQFGRWAFLEITVMGRLDPLARWDIRVSPSANAAPAVRPTPPFGSSSLSASLAASE